MLPCPIICPDQTQGIRPKSRLAYMLATTKEPWKEARKFVVRHIKAGRAGLARIKEDIRDHCNPAKYTSFVCKPKFASGCFTQDETGGNIAEGTYLVTNKNPYSVNEVLVHKTKWFEFGYVMFTQSGIQEVSWLCIDGKCLGLYVRTKDLFVGIGFRWALYGLAFNGVVKGMMDEVKKRLEACDALRALDGAYIDTTGTLDRLFPANSLILMMDNNIPLSYSYIRDVFSKLIKAVRSAGRAHPS